MYVVITCNDDGEICVEGLTKKELEDRLEQKWWGEPKFFDKMPDIKDPTSWESAELLVLKAELVLPRMKEIITKYEID